MVQIAKNPATRVKLQKYFSKAVRENARLGVITSEEMSVATTKTRQSILASLYHCTMLPDENIRHQYCPDNSWGMFKRGLPFEDKEWHLAECFLEILKPVYD